MRHFATLLALIGLFKLSTAATTCNTDLQYYPYCISIPDGASNSKLIPTVLFLQGRGARGPASNVQSLATYDGFGKLVSEYNGGNRGDAQTIAATKFITIVPVAPEYSDAYDAQYWMAERLTDVLNHVKESGAPVDWDRFHVAGYSMGAFGSWRFAVNNPTMVATVVTSGGNAETNSITNSLGQTVQPPADLLSAIVSRKIPTRAYTGTGDSTIPASWLEETQQKVEALGAGSKSTLTILDTDHSGLSTIPFSADLLNWMLQQKRPGAKSGSGKGKGKGKTTKSSSGKSTSKTSSPSKSASAPKSTKTKCTASQRAKRALLKRHAAMAGKVFGSL